MASQLTLTDEQLDMLDAALDLLRAEPMEDSYRADFEALQRTLARQTNRPIIRACDLCFSVYHAERHSSCPYCVERGAS